MKKIMFSDEFLLTKAVLDGRKTQTRRIVSQKELYKISLFQEEYYDATFDKLEDIELLTHYFFTEKLGKLPYNVGEVVAVAQSYETISNAISKTESKEKAVFYCKVMKACFPNAITHKDKEEIAGWYNKKFVRGDLMPNQIRITDVRVERLQDISDDGCIKEGIIEGLCEGKDNQYRVCYYAPNDTHTFFAPREAFAHLINKVRRKDVWRENPYVFVYDFELVK